MARIDKYKIEWNCKDFQPHYKLKGNELVELKPKFYHHLSIVEKFLYNRFYKKAPNNDKIQEILNVYFNESYKAMRNYWKDTKFVILQYPQDENQDIYKLPCWKELEEKFIVINVNDLTGVKIEKYKSKDGWHPSSEAWDIILPKLFDYLKIDYKK